MGQKAYLLFDIHLKSQGHLTGQWLPMPDSWEWLNFQSEKLGSSHLVSKKGKKTPKDSALHIFVSKEKQIKNIPRKVGPYAKWWLCNDKMNALFCGLFDGVAESAVFQYFFWSIEFYCLSCFFKAVNHERIKVWFL